MLTHLHIRDFTLVDKLDIELHGGLTVITGETGAGKSIMLDALGLTLGERTDSGKVKQGCSKADIHASFDIRQLQFARKWLEQHDLTEGDECILRRVITKEGRSRAYINGQTVTLQQLRSLGERLIDIHNQHEHQSLLMPQTHRRLLDEFGGTSELCQEVKQLFSAWQSTAEQLAEAKSQGEDLNARFQLLHYQVEELNELDLQADEVAELEKKQRQLSGAESTLANCESIIEICSSDSVGLRDRLNHAMRLLQDIPERPDALNDTASLLESALINIEEAQTDVERFLDNNDQDPSQLFAVEQRLNTVYEIARKHRVAPEELAQLHEELARELSAMSSGDQVLEELEAELIATKQRYDAVADKLSDKRRKAATKLANAVNKQFSSLAMESAKLKVSLSPAGLGDTENTPARYGNERIEFLISTNPGQAPQSLQKVASGGELSRISLAIQVVTSQTSKAPTLVFDEVDVGIGGKTGGTVGEKLRQLGEKGQVFCVTHLAQVASKAHQHFRIEKHVTKKDANSSLTVLDDEEKILEIARMMGGAVDSDQSLAHAKQMLEDA